MDLAFAIRRIPALPKWLWEWKKLWYFLFVLAACFVAADWIGCWLRFERAERLTYAGWALQMLGVWTVVHGLMKAGQQFDRPSLRAQVKAWWERFPLRRRDVTIRAGSGELRASGSLADVELWHGAAGEGLEERLTAVEQNLETLRDKLHKHRDDSQRKFSDVEAKLAAEEKSRRDEDTKLLEALQEAVIGDIHLEAMGVGWILFGLTASTIPGAVVYVFGWLYRLLEVPASWAC